MMQLSRILLFWFLAIYSIDTLAEAVATVQKVNGVVHVKHVGGAMDLAYEGLQLAVGDTVTTENESTAMLFFADNSQIALRAGTSFQVKAFHFDEAKPAEDNMAISLIKGGLRTLTGFVGKRGNRDAYRLESGSATMGIRGTDFSVRLCDKDCEAEQGKSFIVATLPSGVIGKVAEAEGKVQRFHADGHAELLSQAQSVFVNDDIRVDGHGAGLIVLTDGTRIELEAGAAIKIKQYYYEQAMPDKGRADIDFNQGKLRIVSGQISANTPQQFQIHTPIADYVSADKNSSFAIDLLCTPSCDGEQYARLRSGLLTVKAGDQTLEVKHHETVKLSGQDKKPVLTENNPDWGELDRAVTPENKQINEQSLFGMGNMPIAAGLYAAVNDGRIVISQADTQIEVDKGDTGFAAADGSMPITLPVTPSFLDYDPQLSYVHFVQGLCK